MEALQRIPMSWEEYLRTPEHPRYEWLDGVAVMVPDPTLDHQHFLHRLTNLLERSLPDLFVVGPANLKLPRNRVRIPDLVVLRQRERGLFVETVPVLVAEVLSPSTRTEDTMRKSGEYAEAGIGQYWLLDPEAYRLDVLVNVEGEWEQVELFDERRPAGAVRVEDHGEVPVDLAALLA